MDLCIIRRIFLYLHSPVRFTHLFNRITYLFGAFQNPAGMLHPTKEVKKHALLSYDLSCCIDYLGLVTFFVNHAI